jgi:hypothetical protein
MHAEADFSDGVVAAFPERDRDVPRSWCCMQRNGEGGEMKGTKIGADLADCVPGPPSLDEGDVKFRKRLTLRQSKQ